MSNSDLEYEIRPYNHEHLTQVAELLQVLWGNDISENISYFNWKYSQNPYAENPLGIVALYKGKVVGFRGFFATKWRVGRNNREIIILSPGDTCVHSDHRRKGLSVFMAHYAMEEYKSKYMVFFNLTSNNKSTPGYLKLGFSPLASKINLTIYKNPKSILYVADFLPAKVKNILKGSKLLSSFFSAKKRLIPNKEKNILGDFGEVVVSDVPWPKEMNEIVCGLKEKPHTIKLVQDNDFFRWRFNNKRNKYFFYYCIKNHDVAGYMVIKVSDYDPRLGRVVDYAENKDGSIEKILRHLFKFKHFDVISIYSFGISENFMEVLKIHPQSKKSVSQKMKTSKDGELPLLVRPVKKELSESDWFIDGIDIRKIENWEIKPISSDDA